MPNWCENNVTVKHDDPVVIVNLKEAFEKGEMLQSVVPMDKALLKDKFGVMPSWYNWRVENWGTKWDVGRNGDCVDVSPTEIILYFDSAWSPPTEAYGKMEEFGFTINASYHEMGMCFYGTYADGVEASSEYAEFNQIPDWVVDMFSLEDYSEED